MPSLQNIIIAILTFILIAVIIAYIASMGVKNKEIERLGVLNTQLNEQIGQAEASMKLQNMQIEQFKVDIAKAEASYNEGLRALEDKYAEKFAANYDNATCQEMLSIIDKNQKDFLYDR